MINLYQIINNDIIYRNQYPDELHLNLDLAMEFMDKFLKDNLSFTDSNFVDWKNKNFIILQDDKLAVGKMLQYNNGYIYCMKVTKSKTLLFINRENKLSIATYNRKLESVVTKLIGG